MELVTNKPFGTLDIDVYMKDDELHMSRRQINEALGYLDDRSLTRIISNNKDVIGEGTQIVVIQQEGTRSIKRTIEVFKFSQVFQILRFSKSKQANAFMDFTCLTMQQLLSGNATLEFRDLKIKERYIQDVKIMMQEYSLLGIKRNSVALLIQRAKIAGSDPDVAILDHLQTLKDTETARLRERLRNMVSAINEVFEIEYPDIWHALASEMAISYGINVGTIRRKSKKANEEDKTNGIRPARMILSYPEIIQRTESFQEAFKCLKKLARRYEKAPKAIVALELTLV